MSQQEFYETVQLAEEYYMTQPLALRLADWFEKNDASFEKQNKAAAELRRLHEVNAELLEMLQEAVSMLGSRLIKDTFGYEWHDKTYAVIAKATGEHNEKLG